MMHGHTYIKFTELVPETGYSERSFTVFRRLSTKFSYTAVIQKSPRLLI